MKKNGGVNIIIDYSQGLRKHTLQIDDYMVISFKAGRYHLAEKVMPGQVVSGRDKGR